VFLAVLIISFLQTVQPEPNTIQPAAARGDRFRLAVPQGWKTLNEGGFVLLEHSSGASLLVQRATRASNLADYARQQAERVMMPLGFAQLGEPQHFKDTHEEWIQYEILGNRISERHRILYRVMKRDASLFESIYEAKEDRFDVLLTEAQEISSSIQAVIEAPPTRRTRR
jgi:hypothetical protein